MNIVALVGNVATDPELRRAPDGASACSFRVAVARPAEETADFFTIRTSDRQAEDCREHLAIGRRVAIEGRMRSAPVRRMHGEAPRYRVEVFAHQVELLSRGVSTPRRCVEAEAMMEEAR